MLIISFDAVCNSEYDRLMQYPNFRAFAEQSAVFRNVSTIFLSNTYPVHTSVVTGVKPNIHGVSSNIEPFPSPHPVWNCEESCIRVKTIWQLAAEKGIKTAAVLWPVTAYSKTIRYNMPEILARPGKSQLFTNLKAGNFMLQLKLFLRHRKLFAGSTQPNLDNFVTACMADILREKKPGLALVHLSVYDTLCHKNGRDSAVLETALQTLDKNLATLLEAAGDDRDIIVFSDHSQLNVHTILDPNKMLVMAGLLHQTKNGYLPSESGCFFECCGGSAFFHPGRLAVDKIEELRKNIEQSDGYRRFLTSEELNEAGIKGISFGFCAQIGFTYEALVAGSDVKSNSLRSPTEGRLSFIEKKAANHGYPLDMPDYNVFYLAKGCGLEGGKVVQGGSLLDIAPLVTKRLDLR